MQELLAESQQKLSQRERAVEELHLSRRMSHDMRAELENETTEQLEWTQKQLEMVRGPPSALSLSIARLRSCS